MKKSIFTIMLTLISVMVLTSCYEQQSNKGDQLTTMMKVEASKDLIDVCDIEITYKGKGGFNTIDTISATEWYKIVVNDSFPTKIGVLGFRYLIKPGFKPTKDKYNLDLRWSMGCKEQKEFDDSGFPLDLYDVPGDKVESFLDLYNMASERVLKNGENSAVSYSSINGSTIIYTVTKAQPGSKNSSPFKIDVDIKK